MGVGVLLHVALLVSRCYGFLVVFREPFPSNSQRIHTSIEAVIFGPDGSMVEDEAETQPPSSFLQPVDSVFATVDADTLVRIACAFADPPLSPSQVQHAQVINFTSMSMSISVAVVDPGDDTCVEALVQVPFLEEMGNMADNPERHVDLLQKLDEEARRRLEEREYLESTSAARQRITRQLQELPEELPEWWVVAGSNERLAEECTQLKALLNEDEFAEGLQALFTQRFPKSIEVAKACVAVIGPAGMFMKAYARESESPFTAFALPIPFSTEMEHADDLRNAVLDIVENRSDEEASPEEHHTVLEADVDGMDGLEMTELAPATNITQSSEGPVPGHKEVVLDDSSRSEATPSEISKARKQPKSREEEKELAAKYAAIEELGDRAYAILKDLYMI